MRDETVHAFRNLTKKQTLLENGCQASSAGLALTEEIPTGKPRGKFRIIERTEDIAMNWKIAIGLLLAGGLIQVEPKGASLGVAIPGTPKLSTLEPDAKQRDVVGQTQP